MGFWLMNQLHNKEEQPVWTPRALMDYTLKNLCHKGKQGVSFPRADEKEGLGCGFLISLFALLIHSLANNTANSSANCLY